MQLHTISVAVAHLGNFLPLTHGLVFFDQQRLVVRISRQVGVVVLQDNQVPVAAQTGTDIDHATIGRRHNSLTRSATNIKAFILHLVKACKYAAAGGPDPGNFVFPTRGRCRRCDRRRGGDRG